MATPIKVKLESLTTSQWMDALCHEMSRRNLSESVSIKRPSPTPGALASIDPAVAAALVTGGAQILASLITLLGAIYVAKRSQDKTNPCATTTVQVVLEGHAETATAKLDVAADQELPTLPDDELFDVIESVGEVRRIIIKE